MSHTPTCDKLNQRSDEWKAIYQFIEWLQENRMCIGVWRDPNTPYYNAFKEEYDGTLKDNAQWLLEHPYPWSNPTENLLYKYFDIDPNELEKERRQILKNLQALEDS